MSIRKLRQLWEIPREIKKESHGTLTVSSGSIHLCSLRAARAKREQHSSGGPYRLTVRICSGGIPWLSGHLPRATLAAYATDVRHQCHLRYLADRFHCDCRKIRASG